MNYAFKPKRNHSGDVIKKNYRTQLDHMTLNFCKGNKPDHDKCVKCLIIPLVLSLTSFFIHPNVSFGQDSSCSESKQFRWGFLSLAGSMAGEFTDLNQWTFVQQGKIIGCDKGSKLAVNLLHCYPMGFSLAWHCVHGRKQMRCHATWSTKSWMVQW